SAE
ncbi:hypothetical protein D049_4202B, partial [Vibrio parahaemolyticus VPTS-2010]